MLFSPGQVTSKSNALLLVLSILVILLSSAPKISQAFVSNWYQSVQKSITPHHTSNNLYQNQILGESPTSKPHLFQEFKKCFGHLGCVEGVRDWYSIGFHNLHWLPQDADVINTTFSFYSRKYTFQPLFVESSNKSHLEQIGFDPRKPVKFIVHSFLESSNSHWPRELARVLLHAGDFNIFVVNWANGAVPLYVQAAPNSHVVGLEIAYFLKRLKDHFNFSARNAHCIGHGIGAHACGFAGVKVKGAARKPSLGRITGLDPAGPIFEFAPPQLKLSPEDARFVDVIHTNGQRYNGYGTPEACGHVDFFVNGGNLQPGCYKQYFPVTFDQLGTRKEEERQRLLCNHQRSVDYFIEAVRNSCKFVGHLCNDAEDYFQGKCASCKDDGSKCAIMGLEADKYETHGKTLVIFQVSTADKNPFCVRHYMINIKLGFPEGSDDILQGQLKIRLHGDKNSLPLVDLNPKVNAKFHRNDNLTFMVQNFEDLGKIKQILLEWKADNGIWNYRYKANCLLSLGCNYILHVEGITVSNMDYMGNAYEETNLFPSTSLCSEKEGLYTGIQSGSSALFRRECQ